MWTGTWTKDIWSVLIMLSFFHSPFSPHAAPQLGGCLFSSVHKAFGSVLGWSLFAVVLCLPGHQCQSAWNHIITLERTQVQGWKQALSLFLSDTFCSRVYVRSLKGLIFCNIIWAELQLNIYLEVLVSHWYSTAKKTTKKCKSLQELHFDDSSSPYQKWLLETFWQFKRKKHSCSIDEKHTTVPCHWYMLQKAWPWIVHFNSDSLTKQKKACWTLVLQQCWTLL